MRLHLNSEPFIKNGQYYTACAERGCFGGSCFDNSGQLEKAKQKEGGTKCRKRDIKEKE